MTGASGSKPEADFNVFEKRSATLLGKTMVPQIKMEIVGVMLDLDENEVY